MEYVPGIGIILQSLLTWYLAWDNVRQNRRIIELEKIVIELSRGVTKNAKKR